MPLLLILISGMLFGAGVTLSGMVNPAKVLNFMDVFGAWDPTLILVMGGALATTFLGYRMTFGRGTPLFAESFASPAANAVDARLLAGAALFGLGWGLSGFCPGPALASLIFGHAESWIFVVAMAGGMLAVRALGNGAPKA